MVENGSPLARKTSNHTVAINDQDQDPSMMLAALGAKLAVSASHNADSSLTNSKIIKNQQSRNAARSAASKLQEKPQETTESEGPRPYINADGETTHESDSRSRIGRPAKVDTSAEPLSNLPPFSHKVNSTPANDNTAKVLSSSPDLVEFERLKKQLTDAHDKIARMDQELHQSRITKHTLEQTMGPSADNEFEYKGDVTDQTISTLQHSLNVATRGPRGLRQDNWQPNEETRSETSEPGPSTALSRPQVTWQAAGGRSNVVTSVGPPTEPGFPIPSASAGPNWNVNVARPWFQNGAPPPINGPSYPPAVPLQRGTPGLRIDTFRNNQMLNEPAHFSVDGALRRGASNPPTRPTSAFESRFGGTWGYMSSITSGITSGDGAGISPPLTPLSAHSMGVYPMAGQTYQPRAIGTRLSPTAAEFSYDNGPPAQWNGSTNQGDTASTYVASVEPMNYRRLLDRNMSCNWKYIVDKIVCNNDQQASIFLQQKLKVGTTEQKHEIVDSIIAQAFPLMVNRFGNFLIQRCFEHGTAEQIVQIADAIQGNTLQLSMDAFGCHVVQKAFDAVPEEYKAVMVHELLRCIPETVIHRYACHVWQKLFELRWSDSPPQIMKYVNEALRGMWHEVALGETGSLVVQNIFENCLEEDKRPCINEVLASIDVIAHGQFGNWCIQHICEHGAPADRSRAIDHILRFATEYSMDQYASKVIEKCLKIGGNDFLDRYLERVCEARPDRPRMPLIDIAGDQFGNYLVQYILTHASPQHRDLVSSHVRKHMVSLRGSKYGSRVAMLCCNPAFATRPGPPAGMQVNRYNVTHASRGGYGNAYR